MVLTCREVCLTSRQEKRLLRKQVRKGWRRRADRAACGKCREEPGGVGSVLKASDWSGGLGCSRRCALLANMAGQLLNGGKSHVLHVRRVLFATRCAVSNWHPKQKRSYKNG